MFLTLWFGFLGLFVYDSLHFDIPQKENSAAFFTSDSEDDLKFLICKELRKATRSVYVASFGLSDKDIANILHAKAAAGVSVHVYYDPKQPLIIKHDSPINLIPYQKSALMHKKILAIDEELLFFGSTNLTPMSLLIHKNMVVCIRSKELYQACMQDQMLHYEQGGFFPLPEYGKEALAHLIQALELAKKRVYVAIYTLTHPKILAALIKASERGVDVRICMDRSMASGVCKKAVKVLQNANIHPKTNTQGGLLHHKCALIDDTFIYGSANWTKSAFSRNQEYFFYIKEMEENQLKSIESFFHTLQSSCR